MALTVLQCLRTRWSNFKYVVQSKPPLVLFVIGLISFCIVLATLARIVNRSNIETDVNENWDVFLNHFSKLEFCVSPGNASYANYGEAAMKRAESLKKVDTYAFTVPVGVHFISIEQFAQYSNLTVMTGAVTGKSLGLKGDLAKQIINVVIRFSSSLSEFATPCGNSKSNSKDTSNVSPGLVSNSSSNRESDNLMQRKGGFGSALRDFWCSSSFEISTACVEFIAVSEVFPDSVGSSSSSKEHDDANGPKKTDKKQPDAVPPDAATNGDTNEPERCDLHSVSIAGKPGAAMTIDARRPTPYSSYRNRNCDGNARLTLSHKIDPSLLTALTLKDKTIIYLHLSATIYFLLFCIFCTLLYACFHSKRIPCAVASPLPQSPAARERVRSKRDIESSKKISVTRKA